MIQINVSEVIANFYWIFVLLFVIALVIYDALHFELIFKAYLKIFFYFQKDDLKTILEKHIIKVRGIYHHNKKLTDKERKVLLSYHRSTLDFIKELNRDEEMIVPKIDEEANV